MRYSLPWLVFGILWGSRDSMDGRELDVDVTLPTLTSSIFQETQSAIVQPGAPRGRKYLAGGRAPVRMDGLTRCLRTGCVPDARRHADCRPAAGGITHQNEAGYHA